MEESQKITLTLQGSRAERGVGLADLEGFIEGFLGALRDFDRDRRGAPTRKAGYPEQRARAVTAFQLIRFKPGSGIATLEPQMLRPFEEEGAPPLFEPGEPPSLENLRDLLESVATGSPLSTPVSDSLGKACKALGDHGSFRVDFPTHLRGESVTIDLPLLERLANPVVPDTEMLQSVSGRLHLLDTEPDKIAIRTSTGVDWVGSYPPHLEPIVKQLVDRIVWAEGTGQLVSPLKGNIVIERIETVEEGEQTALFTHERISDADLLQRQGIDGPQGLVAVADPEWDEEADADYLAALTDI